MPRFRKPGPLGRVANVQPTDHHLAGNSNRFATIKPKEQKRSEIPFLGSIDGITDGEVRVFDVSEYSMFFLVDRRARQVKRSPRLSSGPVIYVNGMAGNPSKFRAQACAVAAASGGPVYGVYNDAGTSILPDAINRSRFVPNFLVDLLECTTDKLQSTDLDQFKVWVKEQLGVPQSKIQSDLISSLRTYNRAAGSLLELLLRPGFENATIVAHSQGNIITCNAVNAVAALRGTEAIGSMRIIAVASPVLFWSEAGQFGKNIVTTHAFANDLVAWLGMNLSTDFFLAFRKPVDRDSPWTGTEVSEAYARSWNPLQGLTHNFYAYLERMWEILVPQFP